MLTHHRALAAPLALLAAPLAVSNALAQVPAADTQEELYIIGQRLEETTPQELARFGNRLETLTAAQLELGW